MKISKRIQQIAAMVGQDHSWHHIWDCCCDHGHLGMNLLSQNSNSTIHFVDIVPSITELLTEQLKRFFKADAQTNAWQVHCLDVANLPINNFSSDQRHLVIIAGVGGEQSIAMVQQILARFNDHQLDFLLCPLRHQFKLRSALQAMNLGLVDECLIKENKRFYEIIHVSNTSNQPIVAQGSILWQQAGALEQAYLAQTLGHYQRMDQNTGQDVGPIIAAYRQLNLSA